MNQSKHAAAVKLAMEAWDELAQADTDREVDKDAVVAAIEDKLVLDVDQMRHDIAVQAVNTVDRKRTTPSVPYQRRLELPGIPEDEYLVVGDGRRVQRAAAKIRHVLTTIGIRWKNVQDVTTEAQAAQAYYAELMEDLAVGMTESEALDAYQQRNGITFPDRDSHEAAD